MEKRILFEKKEFLGHSGLDVDTRYSVPFHMGNLSTVFATGDRSLQVQNFVGFQETTIRNSHEILQRLASITCDNSFQSLLFFEIKGTPFFMLLDINLEAGDAALRVINIWRFWFPNLWEHSHINSFNFRLSD